MENFIASFCKNIRIADKGEKALTEKTFLRNKELIAEVLSTQTELKRAYINLGHVTDADITDYYIYLIKALEAKYKYLNTILKKDKITRNDGIKRA